MPGRQAREQAERRAEEVVSCEDGAGALATTSKRVNSYNGSDFPWRPEW